MNQRFLLTAGIVIIVLGIIGLIFILKGSSSQSGLLIDSNPEALIYINGKDVGSTPYQAQFDPGDITLSLAPQGKDVWSTKLTLVPGIQTVVKREFGESNSQSSGEILSYEKTSSNSTALTIVSSPSSAQVEVDGEIKGLTPQPIDLLSVGDHRIVVSKSGYKEREMATKTRAGYKLTIVATLAEDPKQVVLGETAETPPEAAEQQPNSPQIKIIETGTGFLRVRTEASSSSSEIAQVHPGETYSLIEEQSGWIKIEYIPQKFGWVSTQYTKKVD